MKRPRVPPRGYLILMVVGVCCFLVGFQVSLIFHTTGVGVPVSDSKPSTTWSLPTTPVQMAVREVVVASKPVEVEVANCSTIQRKAFHEYFEFSKTGEAMRRQHGVLRIAAFSRLWVPPLHGTGGMQYHALHLYSQLASRGHEVHVFVTGPPDVGRQKTLRFQVNKASHELEEVPVGGFAGLTVHQVASEKNGEYSVQWYENCLTKVREVNTSIGGFHVAHSESWAGVPNIFQIGLQMAVTWHGSMLDWFRNELNLIVHNYRMKNKMAGAHTAKRMSELGSSVAYEAYMLLAVPHHIVISDSAAENLAEINLIEESRVHLIYNGVNPASFQPATNKEVARRGFVHDSGLSDLPGDSFLVGCGGRLEGIKGHHQLSEAMKLLLPKHPRMVLLVSGDGAERYRYEQLKHRFPSQVYLLGMLKQSVLAKFYQILDVFVDPFYQHHGLNTVMLEAVLTGIPIVVTKLASSKTTAPCEDFGRTFRLGDVPDLARQILHYHDHPDEKIQVGKNVRERAVHLFSSEIMAESYEALLYRIYANPSPLPNITGKVVCRHTYPAMCYREPV